MRTPGRQAGASLVKIGLVIALPVGIAIWAVGYYASQALDPQVSQDEARAVCGVALLLWMVCLIVAEKRTRARLAHQSAGGPRAGFISAVTGSLHVGSMSAYTVTTAWRLVSALLSVLAVLIACGLVVVLAGYTPVAVGPVWAWLVLPLGLGTAFAVARKAASFLGVSLTPRMLGRQTAAWPIGIAGAVAALFTTGVPVSTAAVLGATGGLAVSSTATGITASRHERRKRSVAGQLAAALGVAQSTLDPEKCRWSVARDGAIRIHPPLPADVIKSRGELEARLAEHLPTHEVITADPQTGITLGLVGPDTAARRQLLAETEGLLEALEDVEQPDPPTVQITAEDLEEATRD